MTNPETCVLKTDGTNCDMEMAYAFESVGATAEIVHVNQLRDGERRLDNYGIVALPGGFSYGDDIASGKVLANELTSYLSDQLQAFNSAKKPILGICNGFQVLVRTGILPYNQLGEQSVTLAQNTSGRFECRWTELLLNDASLCRFVNIENFEEFRLQSVPMQTAHGEGRFVAEESWILNLGQNGQIVFQYGKPDNCLANGEFPANPNGSMQDIAAICDLSGTVLGMMPHPERSINAMHPNRAQTESARNAAQLLFRNIVEYAYEL